MIIPKKSISAFMFFLPILAQANNSEFYVGLGLGSANIEGPKVSSFSFISGEKLEDDSELSTIYLGYQLNKNLAFEIGYTDIGKVKNTFTLNPNVLYDVAINDTTSIESKKTYLNIKPQYPINNQFSLFGLIGYSFYDLDYKYTGGFLSTSESISKEEFTFGLGGQYQFNDQFSGRLQWTRDTPGDLEINAYQASVEMNF